MSVNADQTFSGDSIFENIYVHGKLVTPEEAVTIFNSILVKSGFTVQTGPSTFGNDVKILGPAPAPLSFLRGRYRNRFLIKSPKNTFSQDMVKNWIENTKIPKQIRISIDVDPYTFS